MRRLHVSAAAVAGLVLTGSCSRTGVPVEISEARRDYLAQETLPDSLVMTPTSVVRGQFVGLRGITQFPGIVRMDARGAKPDPNSDTESFAMQSDGTFRFTKPPGIYTLRIYLPGREKTAHVVDGIRVRPRKPCHDPRLGGLDLTRFLRVVRLTIRNAVGQPARNVVCCYHVSGEGDSTTHFYYSNTKGTALVPVATEGGHVSIVDLDAEHQVVRIPSLKSDQTLQLLPAWSLTVSLRNLPALPRNTVWHGYVDKDPRHPREGPQYPSSFTLDHCGAGALTILERGHYVVTMYATRSNTPGKRDPWQSDLFTFHFELDPDKKKDVKRAVFALSDAQVAEIKNWK